MTEKELSENIRQACITFRLLAYHTHDSRYSAAGFPDWVICGRRIIYRELKTERGNITKAQAKWLEKLRAAGGDASVWRPSGWLDGTIITTLRDLR